VNSGKNCRLDRDAVSGGGLGWPKHARITLGPDPHMGRGNFWGNGAAQCKYCENAASATRLLPKL